jgi:PDZ domain-containing protein
VTDTINSILPASSGPSRGRGRKTPRLVAVAFVVLVLVFVARYVNISDFVISPGTSLPVSALLRVPPAKQHPLHGTVMLTTVFLAQAHPLDVVNSWFNHDIALVPSNEITGGLTPSQLNQADAQQMNGSIEAAEVVGLRRLGYQVTEHGTGAEIVTVSPRTPAAGVLRPGDTITAVDAQPVSLEADASTAIDTKRPGDQVSLSVQSPSGAVRQVSLRLAPRPHDPTKGYVGVELATRADRFDFPFKVSISSDGIGGPSAGLAFTLGLIDTLTNGDITNGVPIAATGTINLDGTVGPVGGVAQKTVSVREAGAQVFLVPADEYSDALAHAGKMKVIKVDTLEGALNALRQLGGNLGGLPPAPAGLR